MTKYLYFTGKINACLFSLNVLYMFSLYYPQEISVVGCSLRVIPGLFLLKKNNYTLINKSNPAPTKHHNMLHKYGLINSGEIENLTYSHRGMLTSDCMIDEQKQIQSEFIICCQNPSILMALMEPLCGNVLTHCPHRGACPTYIRLTKRAVAIEGIYKRNWMTGRSTLR